jgi:hypothetical protein
LICCENASATSVAVVASPNSGKEVIFDSEGRSRDELQFLLGGKQINEIPSLAKPCRVFGGSCPSPTLKPTLHVNVGLKLSNSRCNASEAPVIYPLQL